MALVIGGPLGHGGANGIVAAPYSVFGRVFRLSKYDEFGSKLAVDSLQDFVG